MMQKWLRKLRGAIGMALTWGIAWSVVGGIPRWVFGFNTDAPFPVIFGVLGFFAGLIFSAFLTIAWGRRNFEQMTIPRFAAGGAVGGLLLSAVFTRAASLGAGDALIIAPTFAAACALCASGSLALARRAGMQQLPRPSGKSLDRQAEGDEKQKLR